MKSLLEHKKLPIVLAALFLTIHAYAIVFEVNSWPVSSYPMFSRDRYPDDIGVIRLEAVLKDGRVVPIPLYSEAIMARILMHWTTKDPQVFEEIKGNLQEDFQSGHSPENVENVQRVKFQMFQNFNRDLRRFVDLEQVKLLKLYDVGAIWNKQGFFEERIDEEFIVNLSAAP